MLKNLFTYLITVLLLTLTIFAQTGVQKKPERTNNLANPMRPKLSPAETELLMRYYQRSKLLMNKFYPNGFPDPQDAMAEMSKHSGGWLDFLEKPEDAEAVYSRILSEINTRYVISYYPTNETKDGKRRMVKVTVKNHPDYVVWGRKAYIAPMTD